MRPFVLVALALVPLLVIAAVRAEPHAVAAVARSAGANPPEPAGGDDELDRGAGVDAVDRAAGGDAVDRAAAADGLDPDDDGADPEAAGDPDDLSDEPAQGDDDPAGGAVMPRDEPTRVPTKVGSARGERTGEADRLVAVDAGRRRRPHGGCPANMARVRDFCIDRYEAPNRRGAKPLVMQSADDAVAWCGAHHKRLCTEDEWIATCEGDEHRAYPYGATHVDGQCNDDRPWREVHEATLAKWPAAEARRHARELYQATPSGAKSSCVSQDGVRDLTGNVEEWVVRTREHANVWAYILIGCYWSGCYGGGKPTCHSTNNAHGPAFRFYETGFRCCADPRRP